jgi:hypothetical protein
VKYYRRFVAAFCALAAVTGLTVGAAEARESRRSSRRAAPVPDEGRNSNIGVRADRVLRGMSDYLAAADAFSMHVEIEEDYLLPSGQKLKHAASADAAMRRPDRLHVERRGALGGMRLWLQGGTFTLLSPSDNMYATATAPPRVDDALDQLWERLGVSAPVADFVYVDPYAVLTENVRHGFHVGMSSVDGARCHHLAFVEKYIDWQIWISDGKAAVPRKLVITYKTLDGSPEFSAELSDWDFTTPLADALFTPDVVGATRIEFLAKPGTEGGEQDD